MKRNALLVFSIIIVCISNGQTQELRQGQSATPQATTPAVAQPAQASGVEYQFDEQSFIEEYLIGSELPQGFPDFDTYSDTKAFRRDLKVWIKEHPDLVYEHKRIQ